MKTTPCRVTYQGTRYQIFEAGMVRPTRMIEEPVTDGSAQPTGETMRTRVYDDPVDAEMAKAIRQEAARQRRNRNARDRHQTMLSLGLTRVRGSQSGSVYYE